MMQDQQLTLYIFQSRKRDATSVEKELREFMIQRNLALTKFKFICTNK